MGETVNEGLNANCASNSSDRLLAEGSNQRLLPGTLALCLPVLLYLQQKILLHLQVAVSVVNPTFVSARVFLEASKDCVELTSSSKECWSIWRLWLAVVSVSRASASGDSDFAHRSSKSFHDGPAVTFVHHRCWSTRDVDVVRIVKSCVLRHESNHSSIIEMTLVKSTLLPLRAIDIKLTHADPGERLSRASVWRATPLLLFRTCNNVELGRVP